MSIMPCQCPCCRARSNEIGLLSPAPTIEAKPAEPVVDEAMVERALYAYYGDVDWPEVWKLDMRRALTAALRGEGV